MNDAYNITMGKNNNMLLLIALVIVALLCILTFLNKESPRTDEIALLLILYSITIGSFLCSDITKQKAELQRNYEFSGYLAYSKNRKNYLEFPRMKYYAFSGTTYDDSMPTFLLSNNLVPNLNVDNDKPFSPEGYNSFSNDYAVLKVFHVLVSATSSFHKIEPHAEVFGSTTNVGTAAEFKGIFKSSNKITFKDIESRLSNNGLFQRVVSDGNSYGWAENNWRQGITMPEGVEVDVKVLKISDYESTITLTLSDTFLKVFPIKQKLIINVYTESNPGAWIGSWITAYNDLPKNEMQSDYLVVEPEFSVRTEFEKFVIWNKRAILYQKWLNHIADNINEKLNFQEDFKYLPDKMIRESLSHTRIIQRKVLEK